MGKRSREHKKAVIAGKRKPFRASPDKPKKHEPDVGDVKEPSKATDLLERAKKLKENQ